MFAERPDLVCELLARNGHEIGGPLQPIDSNLSVLHPTELRADLVLRSIGEPRHALIVEVQLSADAKKRWTWPAYAATLRLRHRCEVTLLVVAPDPVVAAWCAEPFALVRGVSFAPIVLGPGWIPRIDDPFVASADLELSLLSALAHPADRVLAATFSALATTRDELKAAVYADILVASVSAARAFWEAMMERGKYEFQSDFARKYVALGREEGREEGQREGFRIALVRLWSRKFGGPSPEHRAAIDAADVATLERWLDRIWAADTPQAVFVGE